MIRKASSLWHPIPYVRYCAKPMPITFMNGNIRQGRSNVLLLVALLVSLLATPSHLLAEDDLTPEVSVGTDEPRTILGVSYKQAAVISAVVIGGALVVNSLIGANVGTTIAVIYIGHLIVEAGIVAATAGGSLGLSWWNDDESSETLDPF
jgi:hypothetical protein